MNTLRKAPIIELLRQSNMTCIVGYAYCDRTIEFPIRRKHGIKKSETMDFGSGYAT
jgi:hypothetical protein